MNTRHAQMLLGLAVALSSPVVAAPWQGVYYQEGKPGNAVEFLGEGFAMLADWQPVPLKDGDMRAPDAAAWNAYRSAELAKVPTGPEGRLALRVAVKEADGGLHVLATPRGGMGNRVRIAITARVTSGGPVRVYVGPNTWNQRVLDLASPDWATVRFETGLLYDYHCVLHFVQHDPGAFEIAAITVEAKGGEGRAAVISIAATAPSYPAPALETRGSPAPGLQAAADDAVEGALEVSVAPSASRPCVVEQGLGILWPGTRLTMKARCRSFGPEPAVVGLRQGGSEIAAGTNVTSNAWQNVSLHCIVGHEDWYAWFAGRPAGGACRFRLAGVEVRAELPDPLGPGIVPLGRERRPIAVSVLDAQNIQVRSPWPEYGGVRLYLEATSRWGFKPPASHRTEVSEAGACAALWWEYEGDPVRYGVRIHAVAADAASVEARVENPTAAEIPRFQPMFCWQPGGPRTFAYSIIPTGGRPFPLDRGHHFTERPGLWPTLGWARAHSTGTEAYREMAAVLAEGRAYEPSSPHCIREAGDFPLYARRLPGYDAWVGWVVAETDGYFGNTMGPCMHMELSVPPCPPRATRSACGTLLFFEGSWDGLYARAREEQLGLLRRANGDRSGSGHDSGSGETVRPR